MCKRCERVWVCRWTLPGPFGKLDAGARPARAWGHLETRPPPGPASRGGSWSLHNFQVQVNLVAWNFPSDSINFLFYLAFFSMALSTSCNPNQLLEFGLGPCQVTSLKLESSSWYAAVTICRYSIVRSAILKYSS